jgi:hypothetical protein
MMTASLLRRRALQEIIDQFLTKIIVFIARVLSYISAAWSDAGSKNLAQVLVSH